MRAAIPLPPPDGPPGALPMSTVVCVATVTFIGGNTEGLNCPQDGVSYQDLPFVMFLQ